MSEDATDEIMDATYRALCERGYAQLRMRDIADEWGKSKAALHYHYDGKRDLLVSFLDYLLDGLEERIAELEGDTAADRLLALADQLLDPPEERPHREFRTALLEIKAQAPYDDDYRERLARFDAMVRERVAALVRAGIDSGEIPDTVDPEEVATVFVTTINGAQTRNVALGVPLDEPREMLGNYVERTVVDGQGTSDGGER